MTSNTDQSGPSGPEVHVTDSLEEVVHTNPLITLFGTHAKTKILRALLSTHPTPLSPSEIIDSSTIASRDSWYEHRDDLLATGLVREKETEGNSSLYGLPEDDERVHAMRVLHDVTGRELRDPAGQDARASVLIVDDEEKLAELYARMLDADFEVETASRAEEALAAFDRTVDIVLLDSVGVDDELLSTIQDADSECTIISVSADPQEELSAAFDDYIEKPTTGDRLREVINRHTA